MNTLCQKEIRKTELKWIKFLQSYLGFNNNIYHVGNILKMPDLDGLFSLLECKKRKVISHGRRKTATLSEKFCAEKRINTSLLYIYPRLLNVVPNQSLSICRILIFMNYYNVIQEWGCTYKIKYITAVAYHRLLK